MQNNDRNKHLTDKHDSRLETNRLKKHNNHTEK